MLFVFFLGWLPVFGPWHGLARLVDIARPSLVGVCGVGLGESVVGVARAPEEGLGACAERHCGMGVRPGVELVILLRWRLESCESTR